MKERIDTASAPAAIGPYSQAQKASSGSMLFVSGQIALVPGGSGGLVGESVADEARQALTNLRAVVEAGGMTLKDVVKTTIYLADMGDFPTVNEVYARFFTDHLPARATVAVAGLPLGARVEVDAICVA